MSKNITSAIGRGFFLGLIKLEFRPKVIYKDPELKKQIKDGGFIIIANHVGHNDGQMAYAVFKNSSLTMAKDWMDKGIVKWITKGGNFIPVNRFGTDITWVRAGADAVKNGKNIIIFPEGHTSKGEMDEFKSGFAMLSVMTGAKVIPVYNDGQYHKFFGRRVRFYVGEPMELSREGKGMNAEYLNAEGVRFREEIIRMRGEILK